MTQNVVRFSASALAERFPVTRKIGAFVLALMMVASPFAAMPMHAQAASTGVKFPTAVANDSSTGGTRTWTSINNAKATDGSESGISSSLNGNAADGRTQFLKASGFDFALVPDSAVIEGITVTVRKRGSSANRVKDYQVLVKTASATSQDKASGALWGASLANATYGSSSDTWGLTLTGADIKSPEFAVYFAAQRDTSSPNAFVDSISIEIEYSAGAPADTTAPTLAEVTPVLVLGNVSSPEYTFSSDEEGAITYGGSCASATTTAVPGNNTIVFNTLADGNHNDCTITVTDAADNASLPLSVSPFSIDATGPSVTVTSTASSPTSISPIPFQVSFNEDVADFDEFDVTVDNGTLALFTAESATVYTFEVTPVADGNVTVLVGSGVASDSLGNTNSSGSLVVEYDTTGPGVGITGGPADGSYTDDNTPSFTFTYTGDTVAVECSIDGDETDCTGETSFSVVDPLDDGEYTFEVTVEDSLGNKTTADVTFTIDTTLPEVEISSTLSGATNLTAIPLTVEFDEDVTGFEESDITVTNGTIVGGSFLGSLAEYSLTVAPDAEGAVFVDIAAGAAEDQAGNDSEAAATFEIEYDATAPTIDITDGPADGSTVRASNAAFEFSASDTALSPSVSVECSADAGSTWGACDSDTEHDLGGLPDGSHTFQVRATDAAGNVGLSAAIAFTIDATDPVLSEVTPVSAVSSDRTPSYTFSSTEAGELAYFGSCGATPETSVSDGATTITYGPLDEGTYADCSLTLTDAVGNESDPLVLASFQINLPNSGGGGGGGSSNNNEDDAAPEGDAGPLDLGAIIGNLFGGNAPAGAGAAGIALAGDAGAAGGDQADEGAAPGDEGAPDAVEDGGADLNTLLANALSAFGLGGNAWYLLLLVLLLAGGGWGGFYAYKKFKKNETA